MSPARPNPERDEKVVIPLDPETALRALLKVKPGDEEEDQEAREDADPDGSLQPDCVEE